MGDLAQTLDVLRTVVFTAGAVIALVELRGQYKLRRLQTLFSLNERLSQYSKGNTWISNPTKAWNDLTNDEQYEYQGYLATFEDIGLARTGGLISKHDFITSYGGRYKKLCDSRTLTQYMSQAGYEPVHFENLRILNMDIGRT
jgi:hypothetical protein